MTASGQFETQTREQEELKTKPFESFVESEQTQGHSESKQMRSVSSRLWETVIGLTLLRTLRDVSGCHYLCLIGLEKTAPRT